MGKSSILNKLTGRRKLARISRRRGRRASSISTRSTTELIIVDLPGYGFAKVPDSVKEDWGQLIESYLNAREQLAGIVHLVDCRARPDSKEDVQMHEWIKHYGVPALIAATKADKIPRGEASRRRFARFEGCSSPTRRRPWCSSRLRRERGGRKSLGWMCETAGLRRWSSAPGWRGGTSTGGITMNSKLFTPGPTKVPGAVLNAVGKQVLHHRSPEFSEKVRHVQDELGRLLQTHNDTLLFTCSGTGMMEAAVANLLSRGDKAICLKNGVFGTAVGRHLQGVRGRGRRRRRWSGGRASSPTKLESVAARSIPMRRSCS